MIAKRVTPPVLEADFAFVNGVGYIVHAEESECGRFAFVEAALEGIHLLYSDDKVSRETYFALQMKIVNSNLPRLKKLYPIKSHELT